jgi:carbonic anhydrase
MPSIKAVLGLLSAALCLLAAIGLLVLDTPKGASVSPLLGVPMEQSLINFQTGLKKVGDNFKERRRFYAVHEKGAATSAPTKQAWGYRTHGGPAKWGGKCGGKNQSPIDITTSPHPTVTTKTSEIIFLDYKQGKGLGIVNDGRAIVASGDALRQHKLTVDSYDYWLKRFVFHRPSEHTIDGRRYALEAQLEHVAPNGKRVMLAILFDEGRENKFLNDLNWKHLPHSPSEGGNGITSDMKMNDLIPGYTEHNFFRYFMYFGSMTTPPCDGNVRWVVAKHAAQLSAEQLSKFPFRNNSRPIQGLGDRTIYENQAYTPTPTHSPTEFPTWAPSSKPTHVPNIFGTLAPIDPAKMEDEFTHAPTVG